MQTLNLVRVLSSAGYDVSLCCFYDFDPAMVKSMEEAGARVLLLHQNWPDGLWSLFKKLRIAFRELSPDILHVQYMAPGLIPIIAARLAGVRTLFATVHQPGRTYNWKAKLLLRTASMLCNSFFCVSKAVENSWFGNSALLDPTHSLKKRPHWTIYNASDTVKIAALVDRAPKEGYSQRLGLKSTPVIGCVGRMRGEKGQSFLIEAMAMVVQQIPEAKLVMVGEGPNLDQLKTKTSHLNLTENILWLGEMTWDDAIRHLSIMDIVAVPSLFEGFGLTAAEAMAAGKAVVASNVDGLAEVVKDGVTGVLVPPGNSNALAEELVRLLKMPEAAKEMGQSGRDRVREVFSMDRYRTTTLKAYDQQLRSAITNGDPV